MHVVQANLLPAPEGQPHARVLEQWPSLVDIAEIAASGGARVSVLQAARRRDRVARNGIEYHFVGIDGADDAARGRRFAAALSELAPDVLHVQGLAFAGDAYAISRHLPRLPILCQDHADRVPPWWRRRRWGRWYSAVSAVAFTAAEQARAFVAAGVFDEGMPVFAIPESSSRFTPGDRAAARADTGLHGDPCILWVGHLDHGKDPLTVIDGIAAAAARLPGLHLWCAFGSAPLMGDVQARVRAHPELAGRVHFLGSVPHARVEALMRATDVFVSGSRAESCGYALLEAMACGATPVVTDIPSFRALTAEGRVGHLWPAGDSARLAAALLDAWIRKMPRDEVRRHFDDHLSFAAVGRRWGEAYARTRDLRARSVP